MDFFSTIDAELSACSTWMPNVDSLEFINDPFEVGPYRTQHPDQLRCPNAGPYSLRLTPKNRVYLEHENRLCDILNTLESMDSTVEKEDMEDRVLQELVRINRLKEVEWSGQRSKRGVKGSVVNTGILVRWALPVPQLIELQRATLIRNSLLIQHFLQFM
jgi:hypothetical protein